jgi:hypothetical protein
MNRVTVNHPPLNRKHVESWKLVCNLERNHFERNLDGGLAIFETAG